MANEGSLPYSDKEGPSGMRGGRGIGTRRFFLRSATSPSTILRSV